MAIDDNNLDASEVSQTVDLVKSGVVVVGLGITGLSVVRFLIANDIVPTVVDSRVQPPGADELRESFPQVQTCFGELNEEILNTANQLIVSPGVSIATPQIKQAAENGVEIAGDIELFARQVNKPVIAITGSNGKTTVTTLLGEMIADSGFKVGVGGNIGTPALDLLSENHDFYVLELSSFQLETTTSLKPAVAVVLNISEDHLDRYDSMQHYIEAKKNIYDQASVAVVNIDDAEASRLSRTDLKTVSFSITDSNADFYLKAESGQQYLYNKNSRLIALRDLKIKGNHNAANALAAIALGDVIALPIDSMLNTLRQFEGLPHRTQFVAESNNISWYNDSKATNVGATVAAIQGLPGKLILIAGGESKDADLSPLIEPVKHKARAVVLIGRDANLLADLLAGSTDIYFAKNMVNAVETANEIAVEGDSVLLSPACASFDMFDNYMQRGDEFIQSVRDLLS